MGYSTIRTKHGVGDVVYFYDSETDSVQRGVVVGVEARCADPGYSAEWTILYSVKHAYASDPPARPSLISQSDLHDRAEYAFPPICNDVAEAA